MLLNDITQSEKLERTMKLQKESDLDLAARLFFSSRNTYFALMKKNIEKFFREKGFIMQVSLRSSLHHVNIYFTFYNKDKEFDRRCRVLADHISKHRQSPEVSNFILEVEDITDSDYYHRVKPNYDKEVDAILGADLFFKFMEEQVNTMLNFPFGTPMPKNEKIAYLKNLDKNEVPLMIDKLCQSMQLILPEYFMAVVDDELFKLPSKKYQIENCQIADEQINFTFKSEKDDFVEIAVNVSSTSEEIRGHTFKQYYVVDYSINNAYSKKNPKRSKKLIIDAFNKNLGQQSDDFLKELIYKSVNYISYPLTYESNLSF